MSNKLNSENKFLKGLTILFLSSLLIATLLNSRLFYRPTLTSFYLYLIIVAIITTGISVYLIFTGLSVKISLPFLCFFVWTTYIIINALILKQTTLTVYYTSTTFLLLISLTIIFEHQFINVKTAFYIIIGTAVLESTVCMLQYCGLTKSNSSFFTVTGTWVNPNVTAIFLALAFPVVVFSLMHSHKTAYKRCNCLLLVLLLASLYLLKCRTAFIGICVSSFVQLNYYYKVVAWLKNKKNRLGTLIGLLFFVSLMIQLGSSLYHAKKESADGRKMIWKIASMMVIENPVLGYGYGGFERNYNLAQADYISQGKASEKELEQAGPVNMAYNELLQNAVEGGLLGLVFLMTSFGSIMYVGFKRINTSSADFKESNNGQTIACYSALVSFVTMSLVNFTIQAVPVLCLFITYSSILLTGETANNGTKWYQKSYQIKRGIIPGTMLLAISVFVGIKIFIVALADYKNKNAFNYLNAGDNAKALSTIESIDHELEYHNNYWLNYANIQISSGNYQEALQLISKAKEFSSSPNLYTQTGNCYIKLKQYDKAALAYQDAVWLHPTRFAYRHALMNAYRLANKPQNVIATAKEIIALKPKIPSALVNKYKAQAMIIVSQFNGPSTLTSKTNDIY